MRNRRRLICRAAERIVRAELRGPFMRPADLNDLGRLRSEARISLLLEFAAPMPLFVFDGARVTAVIPTGGGTAVKFQFCPVQINRWNHNKHEAELILALTDDEAFTFVTAVIQAAAFGQCFADQVTDLELYPEDDPASRVWQPCLRPNASAFGATGETGDRRAVQTAAA